MTTRQTPRETGHDGDPASMIDTDCPAAVQAEGLAKSYSDRGGTRAALADCSLTVGSGEFVALLGPNGSGKSTLFGLITGTRRADHGRISVLGEDAPIRDRHTRRKLGVVFQQPGLDALLTVRENLRCQAALLNMARTEADRAIEAAADRLGLTDRLDDRVRSLSGGLARRADLARATLGDVELLLLDEPTAGLDPLARRLLMGQLASLRASDRPPAIIVATHALDEAEAADRVILLNEGSVIADGAPAALRSTLPGVLLRVRPRTIDQTDHQLEQLGDRPVRREADGTVVIGFDSRPEAIAAAEEMEQFDVECTIGPPSLEDVFFDRAGRSLNAGAAR